MKPPFEYAPDFSLPSRQGVFRLGHYSGLNRIALLFAPNDAAGRAALGQVERGLDGWRERDLLSVKLSYSLIEAVNDQLIV